MKPSLHIGTLLNRYWGELFFFIYLVLASFFYLERTLFLDNAFQTFLAIQDGFIEVNANRWPAVINRVLLLLAVKLSLGLNTVLWFFSINYVLVHFLAFALIRYLCKDKMLSLALIAMLTIPVVHGFFWCNSELILALCFLILWFASIRNNKWWLSFCLSIVLAWIHPLILIPFGFCCLLLLERSSLKNLKYMISASLFFIAFIVKDRFFPNWYDEIKRTEFLANWNSYALSDLDPGISILTNSDPIISLVLIISIGILTYFKKIKTLLIMIISIVPYLIILDIADPQVSNSMRFYNEINLYPVFFICLLALASEFKIGSLRLFPLSMMLMISFAAIRWTITSETYTKRIQWITEFIQDKDRCVVDQSQIDETVMIMTWASAYESLVISSLKGQSRSVLITNEPQKFKVHTGSDTLLTEFREYALKDLNISYFQLPEKPYSYHCLD